MSTDVRDEVETFLSRHLVGPYAGPEEELDELPWNVGGRFTHVSPFLWVMIAVGAVAKRYILRFGGDL